MNKSDLIDAVAEQTKLSKKDAGTAIEAFTSVVTQALREGKKVQIVGFGTFEVRERQARSGRNPQTGAEIRIAARKSPVFKAGKGLKEAVM